MNKLAIASVVLGIIVIALRGPMIFSPDAVIKPFKMLIESKTRLRIMGLVIISFGLALIFAAWGVDHTAARVILGLGCLVVLIPLFFMVIFPSIYSLIADILLDLNPMFFRVIGVLGVGVGILFIYLGLVVFRS